MKYLLLFLFLSGCSSCPTPSPKREQLLLEVPQELLTPPETLKKL